MKRLFALILVLLNGCAVVQIDPPNASSSGMASKATSSEEIDVIFVHGMGYEDQTWAAATNAALASSLNRTFDSVAFMKSTGIAIGTNGALLYPAVLGGGAGKINTYSIVWSPIAVAFKKTLCYDVSSKNPPICPDSNGEARAYANGYLKSILLDGALTDVVYYLVDELGQEHTIRNAVAEAVLIILAGGDLTAAHSRERAFSEMRSRHVPLFIMSESLGSKILWDSINELAVETSNPNDQQALLNALGNIEEVYMAANQIPLLSPAETNAPRVSWLESAQLHGTARGSLSGLRGMSALVHEGRKQHMGANPPPLKIVAFSDPNDVLSYKLRPYFSEQCASDMTLCQAELLDVVDVGPHNATNWLGLVENPWAAHTSYWQNDCVKKVLSSGLPAASGCR